MIPGYNHNVKYKERVYHVQTEDSGVANPHVITHLFVGGNIVESRKTSYASLVGKDRLSEELVNIMQGQHKGMLKDLINGRFDDKILERSVNAATLNGPAPLNVEAGAQHRASFGISGSDNKTAKTDKAKAPAPITVPAATAPASEKPASPQAPGARPAAAAAASPTNPPRPTLGGPAPLQAPRPPPLPAAPPAQQAAPRPAAAPAARPAAQPVAAQASPTFGAPPPKRASAQPTANAPAAIARPVPPPAPIAQAPAAADGVVLEAETLARAFESQNESAVDSIFGEDLISEKSLDEVILSYLADDLQKDT